jgi:hypothetical protein
MVASQAEQDFLPVSNRDKLLIKWSDYSFSLEKVKKVEKREVKISRESDETQTVQVFYCKHDLVYRHDSPYLMAVFNRKGDLKWKRDDISDRDLNLALWDATL